MVQKICPVDVISMCSTTGDIRPLRVQMQDENRQLLRINIDEIVDRRQIEYVGAEATVFLCRATLWGKRCLFELKYNIRSHIWSVQGSIR